jgi:hypothetical protein
MHRKYDPKGFSRILKRSVIPSVVDSKMFSSEFATPNSASMNAIIPDQVLNIKKPPKKEQRVFMQNVIDQFHQRSIERSMSNEKLKMQYRSVTDNENSVKVLI